MTVPRLTLAAGLAVVAIATFSITRIKAGYEGPNGWIPTGRNADDGAASVRTISCDMRGQ
jgi:hypothetical protein